MPQRVDYFACTRPVIEQWIAALKASDEARRAKVDAQMAGSATFMGLTDVIFNILATCQDANFDMFKAASAVDLVGAVSAEEGPWVMALRQPAIERIARIRVDESVLECWVRWATVLNRRSEEENRQALSAVAANSLRDLCIIVLEKRVGLFTCSYG